MSHRLFLNLAFRRTLPLFLSIALLAGCETTDLGNRPLVAASPPEPAPTAAPAPQPAAVAAQEVGQPSAAPAPEPAPEIDPAAPDPLQLIPPPGYQEQVRVGLLLPMSGPDAAIGRALLNAAQLALFDLDSERLLLLPRDTLGTVEGAVAAADSVLFEGADLILGPFFSASVAAVAPRALAAGVDVVAFSTDRNVARPGVYIMGFLPGDQVRRVVDYAAGQGLRRFAAMAPDTEYGRRVVSSYRDSVQRAGGGLTQVELYARDAASVSEIVRQLANYDARSAALQAQRKALEERNDEVSRRALARLESLDTIGDVQFDAVIIPDGGERLRAVAALFPFYDVGLPAVRLLGTGQWDDPALASEPALIGGWFAAPDPIPRREFFARYEQTYGIAAAPLATLAYDATALAGVLANAAEAGKVDASEIVSPNGFWGIDGIFRFRPDGTVERGLAVLEMTGEGPKVIAPPPETFEALIN